MIPRVPRAGLDDRLIHGCLIEAEFDDIEGAERAERDLIEAVAAHGTLPLALTPDAPDVVRKPNSDPHV